MHSIYILINSHIVDAWKEQKSFRSFFRNACFIGEKHFLQCNGFSRCLNIFSCSFFSSLYARHVSRQKNSFLCIVLPTRARSRFLRDKLIAMPKLVKANTEVSCFMQEAAVDEWRAKILKH